MIKSKMSEIILLQKAVSETVAESGYRQIRHFEGNTFWQTRIFEPESFDLYAAPAVPGL